MWQSGGGFVSFLLLLLQLLQSQCQPDTTCVPNAGPSPDLGPCCAAVMPALFETVVRTLSNLPLECQAPGCRCTFPPFTPQYAMDTLRGKTLLFLGDSTVRLQYLFLVFSVLHASKFGTGFWLQQPATNASMTLVREFYGQFKNPRVPGARSKMINKGTYLLWHEWDSAGVQFRFLQDWWPDPLPMRRQPHDGWVAAFLARFQPDLLAWNHGMHALYVFPATAADVDVIQYWQQSPLPSINATAHAVPPSALLVWLGTLVPNATMMPSPWRERVTALRKDRGKCRPAWFCDQALRDYQGSENLWKMETAAVKEMEGRVDMIDNFRLSRGRGELSLDGIHYSGLLVAQMRILINLVHVRLVAQLARSLQNKTTGPKL